MALFSPDNSTYVRVEDIRVGKNLLQFFVRVYEDKNGVPVQDTTMVAPYDINGSNPYVQAYDFIISRFPGFLSDVVATSLPVESVAPVVEPLRPIPEDVLVTPTPVETKETVVEPQPTKEAPKTRRKAK